MILARQALPGTGSICAQVPEGRLMRVEFFGISRPSGIWVR